MTDFFTHLMAWLKSDPGAAGVAGAAGAAAASLVDWEGWLKLVRHLSVGTLCAMFLSDLTLPLFEYLLGVANLGVARSAQANGFLTGMVAIYFVEFILRLFRDAKPRQGHRYEERLPTQTPDPDTIPPDDYAGDYEGEVPPSTRRPTTRRRRKR